MIRRLAAAALGACVLALAASASTRAQSVRPLVLAVDATTLPRGLVHVHERVPVSPGAFTLVYPKWIPGEHSPDGPIQNVVALRMAANGAAIRWRRDLVDLYAFHVEIPAGATELAVDFDVLRGGGASETSRHIAIIKWSDLVLYPQGPPVSAIPVQASLTLPDGWQHASALTDASRDGDRVTFAPVSLEMLVDSTLDAGTYLRRITLASGPGWTAELDLFGEDERALRASDATLAKFKRLVREELAVYGARHWRNYHFLLTLSDQIGFAGIEHHEESDNRNAQNYLTDDDALAASADLLAHEFNHSWNGKYRRPADLATPDYQRPMQTDLLWVYEGMTQYYGEVFALRSGLRPMKYLDDLFAIVAASLDAEPGRLTQPLLDTAVAAPFLYHAPGEYGSLRRGVDFYAEGALVWLDADTIIRTGTQGRRSLDDFARAFFGRGADTPPMVVPYTRDDLVAALNAVYPYDWATFFRERIDEVRPHPPLEALERAGWRLAYREEPTPLARMLNARRHLVDERYSLGFRSSDANIFDVLDGTPAAAAGLAPGMRIIAVNGRAFSAELLDDAVRAAHGTTAPIELLVEQAGFYRTYAVEYHGGPRYPYLARIEGRPDLLSRIAHPRAAP